jgi:hypothetical protein
MKWRIRKLNDMKYLSEDYPRHSIANRDNTKICTFVQDGDTDISYRDKVGHCLVTS